MIPSLHPRHPWSRPRCVSPRRMGSDARDRRTTRGFRHRRYRRRRRNARVQACRARLLRGRDGCRTVFRPLEDFASDETEQTKLYWTDDRIVDGDNPLQMGGNNNGKAVGGSPCTSRWSRCDFVRSGSSPAACSATALTGRSIGARCGLLHRGRGGAEDRRPG